MITEKTKIDTIRKIKKVMDELSKEEFFKDLILKKDIENSLEGVPTLWGEEIDIISYLKTFKKDKYDNYNVMNGITLQMLNAFLGKLRKYIEDPSLCHFENKKDEFYWYDLMKEFDDLKIESIVDSLPVTNFFKNEINELSRDLDVVVF